MAWIQLHFSKRRTILVTLYAAEFVEMVVSSYCFGFCEGLMNIKFISIPLNMYWQCLSMFYRQHTGIFVSTEHCYFLLDS